MHSSLSVRSQFSTAVPVLSWNDGSQSAEGIQVLISSEFRDWVRVCVISQIALLIFQDLKDAMKSQDPGQLYRRYDDGLEFVVKLLGLFNLDEGCPIEREIDECDASVYRCSFWICSSDSIEGTESCEMIHSERSAERRSFSSSVLVKGQQKPLPLQELCLR
jgi:hypothetical protein